MKKTAIMTIMGVVLAAGAFAAPTGTLTLTGTVPSILDITVTPDAAASALDLTTDQTNLPVATVVERTNDKNGYTVTLQSTNAAAAASGTGFFQSSDPTITDTLNYTLSYGGTPVSFTSGLATVTDTTAKTTGTGTSNVLTISYSGSTQFLSAGTYADTLTFTIIAK